MSTADGRRLHAQRHATRQPPAPSNGTDNATTVTPFDRGRRDWRARHPATTREENYQQTGGDAA